MEHAHLSVEPLGWPQCYVFFNNKNGGQGWEPLVCGIPSQAPPYPLRRTVKNHHHILIHAKCSTHSLGLINLTEAHRAPQLFPPTHCSPAGPLECLSSSGAAPSFGFLALDISGPSGFLATPKWNIDCRFLTLLPQPAPQLHTPPQFLEAQPGWNFRSSFLPKRRDQANKKYPAPTLVHRTQHVLSGRLGDESMSERTDTFEWSCSSTPVLSWLCGGHAILTECAGVLDKGGSCLGSHTLGPVRHTVHEVQQSPLSTALTINTCSVGKEDILWASALEICVPILALLVFGTLCFNNKQPQNLAQIITHETLPNMFDE